MLEVAVGMTAAWEVLTNEASTDPLTDLPNRRAFDARRHRELDRAVRQQQTLTVALLDVDHLTSVNDRFGPPAGDRVLVDLARRMSANSRGEELIARLGGEEFGWLIPGTDLKAAHSAAERLRAAVADTAFAGAGPLTISIGIACSTDLAVAPSPEALIAAADRALYAATSNGRDRVQRDPLQGVVPGPGVGPGPGVSQEADRPS